jgi:hypothetical protein
VRREAQHEAAFEAAMGASRQLHEEGKVAEDAVKCAALLQQLGQQTEPKQKHKPPNKPGLCEHKRQKSQCKDCSPKSFLLPARAPEEPVQGLRYGPLRAQAPEERLQDLQPEQLLRAQAPSAGRATARPAPQAIGNRQQATDK